MPYITTERTWFGDGLQLVPNANCLALDQVRGLNARFRDKPLTRSQAARIGQFIASRFLGRNKTEWRAYNLDRRSTDWPLPASRKRVLILPSSWNERQGHPDWSINWTDCTDGFSWLIGELGLRPEDIVVRGHPNWSETIGQATGEKSERHYAEWSAKLGLHFIAAHDKASSFNLIQEADLILVNGGSAAWLDGFRERLPRGDRGG